MQPLYINGVANAYEITKRKKKIIDDKPVAAAFFILSHAKLHVQKFINDLRINLRTDTFRVLYMGKLVSFRYHTNLMVDTDSIMLAMTTLELDDVVKKNRKNDWPAVKEKWFSKHAKCKIPGLLKISILIIL